MKPRRGNINASRLQKTEDEWYWEEFPRIYEINKKTRDDDITECGKLIIIYMLIHNKLLKNTLLYNYVSLYVGKSREI